MILEKLIDRTIEVFSPQTALKRSQVRSVLESQRSKFAGAKSDRLNSHWRPLPDEFNSIWTNSWTTLTGRTLQLVRDFPAFGNILNNLEVFVVGTGIKYQPLVRDDQGNLLTEVNQQIESEFKRWAEDPKEFDLAKKINFYEGCSLSERNEGEYGEFIMERRWDNDRLRTLPYSYKLIDPSRLTDYTAIPKNGNHIFNGIEFDPETMQNKSYWFREGQFDSFLRNQVATQIPAKNIIHGFKSKSPDQMRGITDFTTVILLANKYQDYLESELDIQRMSAKWLAFITTPNAGTHYANNPEKVNYDEYFKSFTENLQYMMIERLPPGSEVKVNSTQRNTSSLADFHRIGMQLIAASFGFPEELASNDYSTLKWTNGRMSRNDFSATLKVRQARKITKFCKPVFRDWLFGSVAKGILDLPDFGTNPERYMAGMWIPPGMPAVDPYKEGMIAIALRDAGLMSPQEFIMSRGGDPEKVVKDLAEYQDLLEVNGINLAEAFLPTNTNPQAIIDQDQNNEDEDEK